MGEQLVAVIEQRRLDDAAIALASVFAADPGQLGRVVRSEFGSVERIVEARDATADELETNEVNAGLYAFDATWLRRRIDALTPSASNGELYLTDLIQLAREDGRIVSAVGLRRRRLARRDQRPEPARPGRVGAPRPAQRGAHARRRDDARPVDRLRRLGASSSPQDVTLEPGVVLRGRDLGRRGERPSARARRSTTRRSARGCRVWLSVVERSTVEDGATIGPYSHLRPGSHVGAGAEIGNYAEVKNSAPRRSGSSSTT